MFEHGSPWWDRPARTSSKPPVAEGGTLLRPAARFEALATVYTTPNQIEWDAAAVTRPVWTKDRIPVQTLGPVLTAKPFPVDGIILRPDPIAKTVYLAPSELRLVNFLLSLRKTIRPDGSIAIAGGTAYFTLSQYVTVDSAATLRLRSKWVTAIDRIHPGVDEWSFRPEQRFGLSVSLELPPGTTTTPPYILTSPIAGSVTVSVELTELAALGWKMALEQGAGSTIPGIFRVNSTGVNVVGTQLTREIRTLDTAVGRVLADRGAADIRTIDPQQTVEGKLVVVTNDLVERITVALRPSQGQTPANQTFGSEGGTIEVTVSTTDVASVAIDWSAQVAFTPLGWPTVPVSGRLTSANIWTEMIKPDSWMATYFLVAVPVDERGQTQPLSGSDAHGLVQGVINFTAPYIANGLITSALRAEYLQPVTIVLPRFPGQPFGDVVLTAFANRNGRGSTLSRKLLPNETSIVLLVRPDGRVEIQTNQDALPETSTASDVLQLLSHFCPVK